MLSPMRTLTILLLSTLVSANSADWPQWRGPNRDGSVEGKWPENLDKLEQVWRVELQPSYSSPVVLGDRVFTTETVSKKIERVRALERSTGKVIWEKTWEGSMTVPFFAKRNGDWIRATPATDGETLFVGGMRDVLVALDVKDGAERWRVDFSAKYNKPLPAFGAVSSPLIDGNSLYVQAGGAVCRLDKKTGEVKWRAMEDGGGMMGGAFASPSFAKLGGKRQLLVQAREQLGGVDPETGAVLWSQPVASFRGMNILTPLAVGNVLFTSTYGGKTQGWSASETEGKWSVAQSWEHKTQGYMTTPVVVRGAAFTTLRSGRMMAIDVPTGKEGWTGGENVGDYMSLVTNGERILGLDTKGKLHLFDASLEKFVSRGTKKIADAETWAHVAICGDEIFVRELEALSVWRWK
jgi:outer membrane protein assembly factor BamB